MKSEYRFMLGLVASLTIAGCRQEHPRLRIEVSRAASGYHLVLLALPGDRINARLKPALELQDGTVLRFDSASLTADSGYFSEPPTADLGVTKETRLRGVLRAGICPAGLEVCEPVKQDVSLRLPSA